MLRIIAGDWPKGRKGRIHRVLGQPTALIMPSGTIGYERITPAQIDEVEPVTPSNRKDVAAKAGWGIAGGALRGGAGFVAGILGTGNINTSITSIKLADGRKALVDCDAKDIEALLRFSYTQATGSRNKFATKRTNKILSSKRFQRNCTITILFILIVILALAIKIAIERYAILLSAVVFLGSAAVIFFPQEWFDRLAAKGVNVEKTPLLVGMICFGLVIYV